MKTLKKTTKVVKVLESKPERVFPLAETQRFPGGTETIQPSGTQTGVVNAIETALHKHSP